MKINDLHDEALALDQACRARGVTPMPPKRPGLPVDSWRAIALATLGRAPPGHTVGRGELLQAAGEVAGVLHETRTLDDANRPSHRFYGSPEKTWSPFKSVRGTVRRICNHPDSDTGQIPIRVVHPLTGETLRFEQSDGSPL